MIQDIMNMASSMQLHFAINFPQATNTNILTTDIAHVTSRAQYTTGFINPLK